MNYRKRKADEEHAIGYVNGKPEQRCATCKYMKIYRYTDGTRMSSPRYCSLRPGAKNKCGYKCVIEDKNVCDQWESKQEN